jgi:hypothetical protein
MLNMEGPLVNDPAAAKYLSGLLLEISGRLDQSVATVKERWPAEDQNYRRAVGRVLAKILVEMLNPLYLQHPDLRPPGWCD